MQQPSGSHKSERLLTERKSLAFETVLSIADKLDFVERARTAGFFVRAFFVSTADPTINAARVARRVMEGGHAVPIDKIISRYARSMANLDRLVTISDRAYVYDNSVDNQEARLVARYQEGALRKTYGEAPNWVSTSIDGMPRHPDYESV